MRPGATMAGVATVAVVSAVALAALWLALRLAGLDATHALVALWNGSLGSSYALTSSTLVRATPLILTGLAVALLAGLHPLGVLATGLLFGALESGALSMQREAAVPAVVVNVVEALLVLLILAVAKWRGGSLPLSRMAGRRVGSEAGAAP